jgi:curved DNA-binding protein CbpA
VRRAYRSLARLLHPDRQSDETPRRMAGIQLARLNDILADSDRAATPCKMRRQRANAGALGVRDFIHADGADRLQRAMLRTATDHILDGVAHLVPRSVERLGGFLPGKLARPAGQLRTGVVMSF